MTQGTQGGVEYNLFIRRQNMQRNTILLFCYVILQIRDKNCLFFTRSVLVHLKLVITLFAYI